MFEFLKVKLEEAQNAEALSYVVNLRARNMVTLGVQHFKDFSRALNIHPLYLHAFFFVESANSGFMADGRLVPCPEPHVAYRNSKNGARLAKLHPQLFYRSWVDERKVDRGEWHPYRLSHIDRWDHIIRAASVDFNAGLCGASYGAGQQLGEDWKALGFASVVDFLEHLYEGQHTHLEVMVRKLRLGDQIANLQAGNFREVVRYYNGSGNVDAYLKKFEAAINQKKVLYA
jgi:hypothetical protein